MLKKLDHNLVFVCGFIEHIGREHCIERKDVVAAFGTDNIPRLYDLAVSYSH